MLANVCIHGIIAIMRMTWFAIAPPNANIPIIALTVDVRKGPDRTYSGTTEEPADNAGFRYL